LIEPAWFSEITLLLDVVVVAVFVVLLISVVKLSTVYQKLFNFYLI